MLGSEIVVAVGKPGEAELSLEVAGDLATAFDLPIRTLHVEAVPEEVPAAIGAGLTPDSILVIHSEHANRWSGKWSVAEHVIDEWGGLVVAVGPRYSRGAKSDTVLVAVDGSLAARRAVEPARTVAAATGCEVQFCQVIPAATAESERPEGLHPETVFVVGNDPISALLDQAGDSSMIVLAARGDRASTRASISRTSSGIIAGATQPVMIVGTRWQDAED